MPRPAATLLALLPILLALLAAPAQAAAGSVLIVQPEDTMARLHVDEAETFVYELRNLHPSNLAFVQASVDAPDGWTATVEPRSLRLSGDATGAAANASGTIRVMVRAAHPAYERGTAVVTFTATTADRTASDAHTIQLAPASPFVLGILANPLPPPFDGPWGVFLLDLVAFAVIGAVAIAVQEPLARRLARQSNRPLVDLAVRKLRVPVLVLAAFLGLDYAVGVLPPSSSVDLTVRLLDISIYVLALYLVYKIFDAVLTYYGLKFASRTETKIDDVLIPLFRKVGVVIVVIVGLIMTLRRLEVDLTVFVAGGVVVSMVLAFAAQETLSNFFSGIHLLVDRPFAEGDFIQLAGGEICRVEHVGLRSTRLYHTRREEVIIMPNNKLSADRVTNLVAPDRRYRVDIDVSVSYRSDPAKVERILLDIAEAHPRIAREPRAPEVYFTGFAESAMTFVLRVTLVDLDERWLVPSQLRHTIVRRFREEAIEIPFPQRDLWLRGVAQDAVLQVGGARAEATVRPAEDLRGP